MPAYEQRHKEHLALTSLGLLRELKKDGTLNSYLEGVANTARAAEDILIVKNAHWTAIADVVTSILNPAP